MDCIQARLSFALLGRDARELDGEARAALERHWEVCAACQAWVSQESRVDDALGAAIRAVNVPAALPSKILHSLETRRPRRRALAWASAAAACLLLGLSLGGYAWVTDRPVLTMDDFYEPVANQEVSTPEEVKEWFADMGLAMELPAKFVFENCNGFTIAHLKGRRVPRIDYFFPGNSETAAATAMVFVVDVSRFRVDDIIAAIEQPKSEPIVTSRHRIEAGHFSRDPAESARFIYVVVYTGASLQPFFVARPPAI